MADYSALYRLAPFDVSAPRADFFTPLSAIANQISNNRRAADDQALRERSLAQQEQQARALESNRGASLAETMRHNKAIEGITASRTNAPQVMDVYTSGGERVTRMYDPQSQTFSDVPTQNLPAKPAAPPAVDVKGEQALRKEFEGVSKNHLDVRRSYGRILSSNNDAAGDISMIFGYMRMLDPGSVVREGEFATAQNAAGVPDIIRNMYNRAINGQRLNPDQRDMFKAQAGKLYQSSESEYAARKNQFERLAQRYGFEPTRVIPDIGPEPQKSGAWKAPVVGTVEDGYRFKGGNPANESSWERLP